MCCARSAPRATAASAVSCVCVRGGMRRKIQCVGVWDMAQATTKSKGGGRTSGSTEEGCPIKQIKVASRTRLLPPATQGRARGIRLRGMQKAKERGAWPCVFTSGSPPLLLSDLLASRPLLSLGLGLLARRSWLPSSGCGCGPKEPHGVSYSPFFALQPHTPQARTTSCCPCFSCSLSGLNGLVFIRCQFLTSLVLSCLVSLECTLGGLFLAHAAAGLHCTVQSITSSWAG